MRTAPYAMGLTPPSPPRPRPTHTGSFNYPTTLKTGKVRFSLRPREGMRPAQGHMTSKGPSRNATQAWLASIIVPQASSRTEVTDQHPGAGACASRVWQARTGGSASPE